MRADLNSSRGQLLFILCSLAGDAELDMASKMAAREATDLDLDSLCELLSNEYLREGINFDFEPNQYGLEIEGLIDLVNSFRAE